MSKFNSTIKQKKCKCNPGCNRFPTMGFDGYFYLHAPQEIKDRQGLKARVSYQSKLDKARKNTLSRKIHEIGGIAPSKKVVLRSDLLKTADSLFSKYIIGRDQFNGKVICPCCNKEYRVTDRTNSSVIEGDTELMEDGINDGELIIQTLHFVSRAILNLRYDERNAKAGCCYCNLKMSLHPEGSEYLNFRSKLYEEFGVEEVCRMEAEKRNINKITNGDLEDLINRFNPL